MQRELIWFCSVPLIFPDSESCPCVITAAFAIFFPAFPKRTFKMHNAGCWTYKSNTYSCIRRVYIRGVIYSERSLRDANYNLVYTQIRTTLISLVATVCKWQDCTVLGFLMIDKTAEDKSMLHYLLICFCSSEPVFIAFSLCDEAVNAVLRSSNKSMAVCLIKERDTSLTQHQATYKIFRWRRGRQ